MNTFVFGDIINLLTPMLGKWDEHVCILMIDVLNLQIPKLSKWELARLYFEVSICAACPVDLRSVDSCRECGLSENW
jgi:hypothetical protein